MLKHKRPKRKGIRNKDYLSTGSTLLNLACTGKPNCGFAKGHYYFLVGDSASGKTFLSLTCLAEASINKNFDEYHFIYDNAEDGALMDIERFFGKKVAERMEPPSLTKDNQPVCSSTIEEFYYHVDDALQENRPFIYVLDSMDSLSSEAEQNKFDQTKEAHRKGKEVTGSYGDGKAKKNSANLRTLIPYLHHSGSILIIISQTRDNIGFGFEKKTRSGGRALRFYACIELWSSIRSQIEKTIQGKKRQLGVNCKVQVKKNRITGRQRNVTIPIYHSFGIDNLGNCVDFLIEEERWTKKGNKIQAIDLKLCASKEKIIRYIEEKGLEQDIQSIVGEEWEKIEAACVLHRKRRYE